jgi:hypothetical protein
VCGFRGNRYVTSIDINTYLGVTSGNYSREVRSIIILDSHIKAPEPRFFVHFPLVYENVQCMLPRRSSSHQLLGRD